MSKLPLSARSCFVLALLLSYAGCNFIDESLETDERHQEVFNSPQADVNDISWSVDELTPGVVLARSHFLDGAPRYVSILTVDVNAPGTRIVIHSTDQYQENPHRMTISQFGHRAGALAATNAGFGHGGRAYFNSGILKIDGEVVPFYDDEPEDTRFVGSSAVGIDATGRWYFRERPGESWDDDWPEVEYALAGGHMLVSGGEVKGNILRNEYHTTTERNHMNRDHPRTAICQLFDGSVALFAVDGRHVEAKGMSLLELAGFMQNYGCVNAINLDGGGSTTMWSDKFGVVNHPSDNGVFDHEGERILRTAIIIYSDYTSTAAESD